MTKGNMSWLLAAVTCAWLLAVLWPDTRAGRRRKRRKWRPTAKDFDALGKVDCREHPRWRTIDRLARLH